MKSHEWQELWRNWEKEDLIHRWDLGDVTVQYLAGRLLRWLTITMQWARAAQNQARREENQVAALHERMKIMEQRMAVLEGRETVKRGRGTLWQQLRGRI